MVRKNTGHYQSFYITDADKLVTFRKMCGDLNLSMSQVVSTLIDEAIDKPKWLNNLFEGGQDEESKESKEGKKDGKTS